MRCSQHSESCFKKRKKVMESAFRIMFYAGFKVSHHLMHAVSHIRLQLTPFFFSLFCKSFLVFFSSWKHLRPLGWVRSRGMDTGTVVSCEWGSRRTVWSLSVIIFTQHFLLQSLTLGRVCACSVKQPCLLNAIIVNVIRKVYNVLESPWGDPVWLTSC